MRCPLERGQTDRSQRDISSDASRMTGHSGDAPMPSSWKRRSRRRATVSALVSLSFGHPRARVMGEDLRVAR
jgi:hypothetical protein